MLALVDSATKRKLSSTAFWKSAKEHLKNPTYSGGILFGDVVDTMTHASGALNDDHEVFSPSLFRLAHSEQTT
jgi:hypothetical protein